MVRTKEIARMSTGAKNPPRKQASRPFVPKNAVELHETASLAAFKAAIKHVVEAPPKAVIQPPEPVVEAPRKATLETHLELLSKQKAIKTKSKQKVTKTPSTQAATTTSSKQPATKTLPMEAATKTPTKQAATTTPTKQAAIKTPTKQAVTKTPIKQAATTTPTKQAATKTPSKQKISEPSPSGISNILISITCQHCKKRQRLDTEVIEMCRREEKRKRNAKLRSHPEVVIDLSEADSDSNSDS
ncbi:hypothetical protein M758_6G162100 [Ceratodon purpureus]|uniref:Uncharacterized protein n=1 Tax=Ceratodon purpureus TaxID=3225 RepID=A0A8T0HI18_CERPU|nr:hypothetical protein KC19_6G168400 [Ceratodon purpureus]KAG0614246.1 hypothetical protein M758_6G162100 [Ceratodon purpureus]